jgi:flavin-binding protein dodecin
LRPFHWKRGGGAQARAGRAATKGGRTMPTAETDHVYKILELVGSSETSIEDAIKNAVSRAAKTVREMKWFEVVQTRGHIENGAVRHYQVTLRVGFTLDG